MKNQKIGFIGAGNMARSLIGGLISSGIKNTHLFATDPNEETRHALGVAQGVEALGSDQGLGQGRDARVAGASADRAHRDCPAGGWGGRMLGGDAGRREGPPRGEASRHSEQAGTAGQG